MERLWWNHRFGIVPMPILGPSESGGIVTLGNNRGMIEVVGMSGIVGFADICNGKIDLGNVGMKGNMDCGWVEIVGFGNVGCGIVGNVGWDMVGIVGIVGIVGFGNFGIEGKDGWFGLSKVGMIGKVGTTGWGNCRRWRVAKLMLMLQMNIVMNKAKMKHLKDAIISKCRIGPKITMCPIAKDICGLSLYSVGRGIFIIIKI